MHHFVPSCWASGVLFIAGSNVLNMKNEKPVHAGQVFTVSLGVSGLERSDATDERLKVYALQVGQSGQWQVISD